MSCQTPVLFLIFNRPDVTEKVFAQIRKQKPAYLYIAADGPRPDKAGEAAKCRSARQLVLENIDWDCQVKTLLRDTNLGCGKAVYEAINWFFDNVDEGIILEDDCLPDDSFFNFCTELLEKYRDDHRVMHIGGSNFQNRNVAGRSSYYFSNYIHIWGWATWKRAWKNYQFRLPEDDTELDYLLRQKYRDKFERKFWKDTFYNMAHHPFDTWDIQWVYCIYKMHGMGISPTRNLISNIGFNADATHTHSFDKNSSELPLFSVRNIVHPATVKINKRADRTSYKKLFQFGNTRFNRIKFKLGQKIPFVKSLYLSMKVTKKRPGNNTNETA